jgi:hypothetical protein
MADTGTDSPCRNNNSGRRQVESVTAHVR